MIKLFTKIRNRTIDLIQNLKPEDSVLQTMPDVSPPKWHIAHTTWFFEKFILSNYLKDYKVFDDKYNYLFNSYYQSQGKRARRDNRGFHSRPTLSEILEYRKWVNKHIIELLNNNNTPEIIELILLGIHHEEQHQELLLTDLKYSWNFSPFHPEYSSYTPESNLINFSKKWLKVDEGLYEVGYSGNEFHFDNESPRHKYYLNSFEIESHPIIVGEYLEFVNSGGYENWDYWLDEGWKWVQENNILSPLYWEKIEEEWFHYTLNGFKKLEESSILTHISFYEADAFARFKGYRLPTEQEWEIASSIYNQNISSSFLESKTFHPYISNSEVSFFGKVWEWTNSAYLPYSGFKKWVGNIGEYNGKFMISQMVLKGGSCVTPLHHFRNTYRNFFYPHQRWQFTGIRLAR